MSNKDLIQRVREELAAEELTEWEILVLTEEALWALAKKIAHRIKQAIEDVWNALVQLGGGKF